MMVIIINSVKKIGLDKDNNGFSEGSSMTPEQMEQLGLLSTSIEIINKKSEKSIGSRKENERSFWTTYFSWFDKTSKEDLYTVNKFQFDNETHAQDFKNKLENARQDARKYKGNRNQNYTVDMQEDNTVVVTWGKE